MAVATGEADAALGGDQAGSVRIPAALCRVVGLKPTFGLVSCTGTIAFHHCVDHVGPLTGRVAENAQVLSVIAGPDGSDSRQFDSYDRHASEEDYTNDMENQIQGFRIGILKESFELPHSDSQVLSLVERVLETALPQLGAGFDSGARRTRATHRSGKARGRRGVRDTAELHAIRPLRSRLSRPRGALRPGVARSVQRSPPAALAKVAALFRMRR